MKLFPEHQRKEALAHAAAGGQALIIAQDGAFPPAGDLFDQDLRRLVETARGLGQQAVRVSFTKTARQCVTLFDSPLNAAALSCETNGVAS